MRFFKKLTSAILSLLIANPFVSNITKASGNGGDYIDIPDVCEENSINLDMTVIQTPGTDAEKFLKRFFDKDAPYYEKDKQTNETTGVINLFEDREFENFFLTTHLKKFQMMDGKVIQIVHSIQKIPRVHILLNLNTKQKTNY